MKTYLLIPFLFLFASCEKVNTTPSNDWTVTDPPAMNGPVQLQPNNRMPNGGGLNTTDWRGGNIANGWHVLNHQTSPAIQVYMGDRSQTVSSPSQFVLYSPEPAQISGVWHRITFRYQATTGFIMNVRYSDQCPAFILPCPASHEWNNVDTQFYARRVKTIMFYNRPFEPGQVRLDNVNLY